MSACALSVRSTAWSRTGFDGLGPTVARAGVTYTFDGSDRIAVRTAADAQSPTPATATFAYAGVELGPVDDNVEDPTTGAVDASSRSNGAEATT